MIEPRGSSHEAQAGAPLGTAGPTPPVLSMNAVSRSFGPVRALDGATLTVWPGELHGLLGGNGAGKTSLMNILYGLYRMDSGSVVLDGQSVRIDSPGDALRHGVGMVHQHFLQVGCFTVLENIVMGTRVGSPLSMDLAAEASRIDALASRVGLEVDLEARVDELPVGSRQKVEILKALHRGARILVLDEPTTNLTPQETDGLFAALRSMVEQRLAVVFITHKLREVVSACDRITVLREGRTVLSAPRGAWDESSLLDAMVGEPTDRRGRPVGGRPDPGDPGPSPPVLTLTGVSVRQGGTIERLSGVDLKVSGGEIVGVAGVAGNGQRELAEVVLGLVSPCRGSVTVDTDTRASTPTRERLAGGVGYIPDDRLQDGILPRSTVAQNLILGNHRTGPWARGPWIDWAVVHREASALIRRFGIKVDDPGQPAGTLSGGNIQRVLVARALSRPVKLLVAHNPTRGLDIPSTAMVHREIVDRTRAGMATLLISEDLDELLTLATRVVVLYGGRVAGAVDRPRFDRYEIGRMMSGATRER